jgi:outer membrane protein TolC
MNAIIAIVAALAVAEAPAGGATSAGPTPIDPPTLRGMPRVVAMTLPAALAEIDRQNPTLEEARARAAAALGVVKQAAAPLLPNLAVGGGYFHNNASVIITAPSGGALERIYIQPLDAWQGTAARPRRATPPASPSGPRSSRPPGRLGPGTRSWPHRSERSRTPGRRPRAPGAR